MSLDISTTLETTLARRVKQSTQVFPQQVIMLLLVKLLYKYSARKRKVNNSLSPS